MSVVDAASTRTTQPARSVGSKAELRSDLPFDNLSPWNTHDRLKPGLDIITQTGCGACKMAKPEFLKAKLAGKEKVRWHNDLARNQIEKFGEVRYVPTVLFTTSAGETYEYKPSGHAMKGDALARLAMSIE